MDLLPIVCGMGGWGEGEKSGLLNVGWLVLVDLPLLHRPVPYQLQLAHQATRATRASTRAPPLLLHQATLPPWPAYNIHFINDENVFLFYQLIPCICLLFIKNHEFETPHVFY